MDRNEQSEPIMDGSTEATDEEKRSGLAEQVESDHRGAADDGSDDFAERARQAGFKEISQSDEGAQAAASLDEDGRRIVSREPA